MEMRIYCTTIAWNITFLGKFQQIHFAAGECQTCFFPNSKEYVVEQAFTRIEFPELSVVAVAWLRIFQFVLNGTTKHVAQRIAPCINCLYSMHSNV